MASNEERNKDVFDQLGEDAARVLNCILLFFQKLFFINALMIGTALGQAPDTELETLKEGYADYSKNRYAIEMPLTPDNAKNLRDRIRLYHFRLIYLPTDQLSKSKDMVLRVGFFENQKQAKEFIDVSDFLFSGQKIVRVNRLEHKNVTNEITSKSSDASKKNYYVFPITPSVDGAKKKMTDAVLTHAKNLYLDEQYMLAASHYQILATLAEEKEAAWAKELQGLCYEKVSDFDLAIKTYTEILQEFPVAENFARVDQRLRTLQTAAEDGRAAFRKSSYRKKGSRYHSRGVVSQYYRHLTRNVDGGEDEELMSLVSTNFDVRGSAKWSDHEVRARTSGFSILNNLDNKDNEFRLKRAYIDYTHNNSGINVLLGRLKEFDSGVFTSFDGVIAKYPVFENLSISASMGQPIYFTDIYSDIDYFFYSAGIAWKINESWKTNAYYNKQTLFDVTNREAIGGRAHYYKENMTASVNIDYDVAFSELNTFLSNASYRFNEKVNLSGTLGYQRSPFLTATNILIGQAELDLETYLESKQNQDSLLDDALERTALNQYLSLSYNYKISDDLRVIADYYQSNLSDLPSSALLLGEQVVQDTESDSFEQQAVGIQFVNQSLFFRNDSAALGVRFRTGDDSNSTQIFFSDRVRFGNTFSFTPRLMYLVNNFNGSQPEQQQIRYSVSLSYKPFKNTELNLEAGNEHFSVEEGDIAFDSTYFFLGYRVNF